MLIESSEKRGVSEGEAIPVDRLSSLPDCLVLHILSFLPTQQVVATSILSKRWQYVWTFVDTIDFTTWRNVDPPKEYARMVYRVLLGLKDQCIKRMSLCCGNNGCMESDVIKWMTIALDRHVETLVLYFNFKITPPHGLFSSQTLVKLRIHSADITSLDAFTAPLLPKLKKLSLEYPIFNTDSLKRFFSGCPMLEHLSLRMLPDFDETCDISSSTLKWLKLVSTTVHKILLNVPALEFLQVRNPGFNIIVEDKLSSLVGADISIGSSFGDPDHESFSRFLQLIYNVKKLRLNTRLDRPIMSAMHAQFPNLAKLEIRSPYFRLI